MKGGAFGFFSYAMNLDLKLCRRSTTASGNIFEYPLMPKLGNIRNPSSVVIFVDAAFSPNLKLLSQPGAQWCLSGRAQQTFCQATRQRRRQSCLRRWPCEIFKRRFITGESPGGTRIQPRCYLEPEFRRCQRFPASSGAGLARRKVNWCRIG
jgi:hypothetical protein